MGKKRSCRNFKRRESIAFTLVVKRGLLDCQVSGLEMVLKIWSLVWPLRQMHCIDENELELAISPP